jgi:4-carboxymuconolactone decarboxylase
MAGVNPQLQGHFNVGFNVGLSPTQMRSLISVIDSRVGMKEADTASAVLEKAIAARSST